MTPGRVVVVMARRVGFCSSPTQGSVRVGGSEIAGPPPSLVPAPPVLVAAPAYLKSRPAPPAHPRDLIEHACLVFSPTGRRWSFQSSRGLQSVEVSAHMVADDNLTLLHAATAGMGIAVLPRYVATDAIRSGALECLLPAFPLQDHWFRAYVPKRRLRIARVQALVDWLVQDLTAFSEASAPR